MCDKMREDEELKKKLSNAESIKARDDDDVWVFTLIDFILVK